MGPSGSGKSTLLQCAAGLDRPTAGRVTIDATELTAINDTAVTRFRRQRVGFVFQDYNLLPALTVEQNVVLPLRLARRRVDRPKTTKVLDELGLGDRRDELPERSRSPGCWAAPSRRSSRCCRSKTPGPSAGCLRQRFSRTR
jgi:putative ABC transport system ATP-binding protein